MSDRAGVIWRGAPTILVIVGLAAACGDDRDSSQCQFSRPATWDVQLTSSQTGHRLEGSLTVTTSGAQVNLTGISGEGTREPMEYRVDSLITHQDSIHLTFAPLGVTIRARCVTPDSAAAEYAFPWPSPSSPIVGTGFLRRAR